MKFYVPQGEISKDDERKISAAYAARKKRCGVTGTQTAFPEAETLYVQRYVDACGTQALKDLRIGVYRHSSVARDLLMDVMTRLGAPCGRKGEGSANFCYSR